MASGVRNRIRRIGYTPSNASGLPPNEPIAIGGPFLNIVFRINIFCPETNVFGGTKAEIVFGRIGFRYIFFSNYFYKFHI